MAITRGTTPTLSFTLPEAAEWTWDDLADGRVDIVYDRFLLTKKLSDCIIDGRTLNLKLTEENTLFWDAGKSVEIQVCAVFETGDIIKSEIIKTTVSRILNDSPMDGEGERCG